MSQNKTVVPGMNESPKYGNQGGNNWYSRGTNRLGSSGKGTAVPGMDGYAHGAAPKSSDSNGNIPVVGFLYTISRQGIGEFWPLYIGQNVIGQSSDCDICLKEGTVSSTHAILVIRKMKNTDKLIASIKDDSSKNGTLVNGEDIAFNAHECVNKDIITIGSSYELLLILIDAKDLGLKVAENFIPVEEDEFIPYDPIGNDDNFNPYDHNNRTSTNGTVAMDGASSPVSGGTKAL